MFFIILHHISVHGNWGNGGVFFPDQLSMNTFFLQSILPLGKIGVDIFVLISGYFLIVSSRSTWPKLFMLWAEMLFYSFIISAVFALFNGVEFNTRQIFSIFTPFISSTWWFATTYLLMLVASPFVNKMLYACDEKSHLKLIVGLVFLWTILPAVTNIHVQFNDLLWFLTLYIIAAYIRLYPKHFDRGAFTYILIAVVVYGILLSIVYAVDVTGYVLEFWNVQNLVNHNNEMNGPFALVISVCLLLAFRKLNLGIHRFINLLAATTFGIYLIHDHPLVRQWVYSDFFNCFEYTFSNDMALYVLFMACSIFLFCSIVEMIRMLIIDSMFLKKISRYLESFQTKIDSKIDEILKGRHM